MWKYVKKYLFFAILAVLFMVGEVCMDLLQPALMSKIIDEGVLGTHNHGVTDLQYIWRLGLIMFGLVTLGAFFGALNNVFVHMTGQNVGNDIRKDCFCNIMTFSFSQIDKFGTGTLITRVTNDITQVQNFVSLFIRSMIRTTMLMFGSIYFMFQVNESFGWIVLCIFPLILGCILICLYKANPLFLQLQNRLDQINNIMQEDISGIRTIKACVREVYEKVRFGKANDELIKTQLQILIIFAFMNPIVNAFMYIIVVFILLVGSFEIDNGFASPGRIMAAITYATLLLNGVLMLVMLFQNISRGFASWKRVKEILKSVPELKDGNFEHIPFNHEKNKYLESNKDLPIQDILPQHGKIEFRNVSFAYPGSNRLALKHIHLTIYPGETLAIMGATGSGKTSLINLILRFYDVTSGAVLVDGTDVRAYQKKILRDKISVVLQKSELFHASIRENIAWGNREADDKAICQAAQIAQADDFITLMPDAYDTYVAEQGVSLSGGQKQRIAIARAILKSAEILIFDDATSALDLKTEDDLYTALQKITPYRTKIIIAQRIASVQKADRIVVLENGSISACGTHADLMKSSKIYRDIYDSQMGEGGESIA
ncbi:MAG TPA: ABC transporter ATP-binding protein/permease [Firmicutes bacterium]|nr:ABC transporter ATP-binding protein/permease [Bacillota bacterium]